MFSKDSCYKLGYITKLHGFKGELSVFLDTEDPSEYNELESVFVEFDQKLIPFFLEKIHIQSKGQAIVKFEDIDSEKKAQLLVGHSLYLPLEVLPGGDEKSALLRDIIGYEVIDATHGSIGVVKGILDLNSNLVLEIDFDGIEILLPKQDEFIDRVDAKAKRVFVKAPEGLIAMYLGEEE